MSVRHCKKHPNIQLVNIRDVTDACVLGYCAECKTEMVAADIPRPELTKTRTDFDQLTPQDKMAFVKAGGVIQDSDGN